MNGGYLTPSVNAGDLLPPDAAFMARTDLQQTRLLGYTAVHADAVTSLLQGLLGTLPTVRHAGGATPEILGFLRDSGLPVNEDQRIYRTLDEAEAHADALAAAGHRLFWPYPTRPGRFDNAAQLVTPGLWAQLNAKERLGDITPAANLPKRRVVSAEAFAAMAFPGPCYAKAGGSLATGWGFAVRHCPDQSAFEAAKSWFAERRQDVPTVIIEEDAEPEKVWCFGLGIVGGKVTSLGGSDVLLSSPGQQSGNLTDVGNPPDGDAEALALSVGEKAAALGFQGVAGLDIGKARDGRLLVFDPNFRFNASTAQLVYHAAFSRRSGLPACLSFNARIARPVEALIRDLKGPVEKGRFLPLRLFDCRLLPEPFEATLVTGLVSGADKDDAERQAADLLAAISG